MTQKKSERVLYDVKNAEVLKSLIFAIDGYRIHNYEEIAWIDRAVDRGDLGRRFREDWKEIRKILVGMAEVPKSLLHLLKWANIQASLKLFGLIMSTVMIALVGVSMFFFWGRQPGNLALTTTVLSYLALPLIAALIISFAGPPVIAQKIFRELSRYREAHPEKFAKYEPRLKETVQSLIDSLTYNVKKANATRDAKKGNVKPAEPPLGPDLLEEASNLYENFFKRIFGRKKKGPDNSFDLFNADYSGIKISKKPTRFRRFYIVEPEL